MWPLPAPDHKYIPTQQTQQQRHQRRHMSAPVISNRVHLTNKETGQKKKQADNLIRRKESKFYMWLLICACVDSHLTETTYEKSLI